MNVTILIIYAVIGLLFAGYGWAQLNESQLKQASIFGALFLALIWPLILIMAIGETIGKTFKEKQ